MLVRLKDVRDKNLVKDAIMNMESNLEIQEIRQNKTIELGITGNLNKIDVERLKRHRNVDNVIEIKEPFKRANKIYKNEDSIIKIGNKQIGGNKLGIIVDLVQLKVENS